MAAQTVNWSALKVHISLVAVEYHKLKNYVQEFIKVNTCWKFQSCLRLAIFQTITWITYSRLPNKILSQDNNIQACIVSSSSFLVDLSVVYHNPAKSCGRNIENAPKYSNEFWCWQQGTLLLTVFSACCYVCCWSWQWYNHPRSHTHTPDI